MVDLSSSRRPPLADQTTRAIIGTTPPATRFILRGVDSVAAASHAFGVEIPTQPLRSATNGARSALWLGPDEWLLLAPEAETDAVRDSIEAALANIPHALVDVSHRQTALTVEGPGAAFTLNSSVGLDLSLEAFPVGMVARTFFEKSDITLWRVGPESFRVLVLRSFAPYVHSLLELARLENAALAR